MVTKRDIVSTLKRDELQTVAEFLELEVADRRVREDLIDSIVRSKRARLQEILGWLPRDRLKDICVALGLDDSGREKAVIVARIIGNDHDASEGDDDDADLDTGPLLSRTLGAAFRPDVGGSGTWPARGNLVVGNLDLAVDLYARPIGGSSRGNDLERRFQNPSQHSPIVRAAGRYPLLLGLWSEQGDERTVVVAFDAFRRLDRTTRFSLFMPLTLLEQAADTGFATHANAKGETIYAFRPENLARYLTVFLEETSWSLANEDNAAAVVAHRQEVRTSETLEQTTTDSIYIRPRVGMYTAFARLNYKPWFALAEFVDNSIQSFLDRRAALEAAGHTGPLVIDVNLDENELSVTDRAGGIAWKDFPRAFSPAAPPDDPSGLSEFGLGMKAAACWFSRRWHVRTSALGEGVERTVQFDIPKISREGLENLAIENRPSRDSDHFTVITMTDLRVRPRGRTLSKIKEHLASIYRLLVTDGTVQVRVTAGGRTEELSYAYPELLEAPYYRTPTQPPVLWRKQFNVDLGDKRVAGWGGIMRTGSHSRAGFSVFRRRRLIEGSVGDTYKPDAIFGSPNSFASQRVVGEIFVEGFDVSHTKDGIQWHGYEDQVLESIARQLNSPELPILDQADGYRARKTAESLPPTFGVDALNATASALSRPSAATSIEAERSVEVAGEPTPPADVEPEAVLQHREVKIHVKRDGKLWDIHLRLVRDPAMPFFVTSVENRDGQDLVDVEVNLDHPFSVAFINDNEAVLQPLLRLIAAIALGEKVARDAGVKNAGAARQYANQLLRAIVDETPTGGAS